MYMPRLWKGSLGGGASHAALTSPQLALYKESLVGVPFAVDEYE